MPIPESFYFPETFTPADSFKLFLRNIGKQDLEIERKILPASHFWNRKAVDEFLTADEEENRGRATQVLIDKAFIGYQHYVPSFSGGIFITNAEGEHYRIDPVVLQTPLEQLPLELRFIGGFGFGCVAVAHLDPNGAITSVKVLDPGTGYTTPCTCQVFSKTGSGAVLKPRVNAQGRITKVDVITPGQGYGTYDRKNLEDFFTSSVRVTRVATLPGDAFVSQVPGDLLPYGCPIVLNWGAEPEFHFGGDTLTGVDGHDDMTAIEMRWDESTQRLNFLLVPLPRTAPTTQPFVFNETNPLRFASNSTEFPNSCVKVGIRDGQITLTRVNN